MRLIDADTLPVHKAYCVDEAGWGANFYVVDKSDIDKAPTIDAVPVVRCKDCKHLNKEEKVGSHHLCNWHSCDREGHKRYLYVEDMDFCSCGERRSE